MTKPMIRYACDYKHGWFVQDQNGKTLFIAGGFDEEHKLDAEAMYEYFVAQGYQPYVKNQTAIPNRVIDLVLKGIRH